MATKIENYIYNKHIRNKAFEIQMDLQELDEAYVMIENDQTGLFDKLSLFYTQLQLVRTHIKILLDYVQKIDKYFEIT